jgi:hypothetical protein
MQAIATAANTIRDIVDFNSPFNNTFNLGKPFLVEYDNTISLQPPPNPNYDFNAIIFDHGIIFFITNSTIGELASLNNTVYVYKDKLDERRGNLTIIAWEWKGGNAINATTTVASGIIQQLPAFP